MKSKKKNFSARIVSILLLVLAFALVLSACVAKVPTNEPDTSENTDPSQENGNGGNDTPDTPDDHGGETVTPELNVSFDETAAYQMDAESISDALDVMVVSNGVSRKVEFSIKSSEITADGQYIEVTISAEGLEQTVLLPYAGEQPAIRAELKPLYDLLTEEGDKAFALTVSGQTVSGEGAEPSFFNLKAIVNTSENDLQFALVDETGKSVVLYQNGTLTVCGVVVPLEDIAQYFALLTSEDDTDFDFDEEDGFEGYAETGEAFPYEGELDVAFEAQDGIETAFVALSQALDVLDMATDSPIIGLSKQGGLYSLNTNSQKMIQLIQLFLDGEKLAEVNKAIDFADEMLNGALKAGNINLEVHLGFNEDKILCRLQLHNAQTGEATSLEVSFAVSREAFDLPEAMEPDLKDIEITIPFALPQNNIDITWSTIIHVSDIITGAGDDYITSTISDSGRGLFARFALTNGYVYLDLSGLATLFVDEAQASIFTFYQAFEIDGEPASFLEVLPGLISGIFGEDEPDPEDPHDPGDWGDEDDDPRFAYGYGCAPVDGDLLILPIGATEQDLRDHLNVYIFDEDDNQIEFTEYQVEDFNSSDSFVGYVTIAFSERYRMEVDIVIFDPASTHEEGLQFGELLLELNTDVELAQSYIGADICMSDGTSYWYVSSDEEFTIDSINQTPVAEYPAFNQSGDFDLVITRVKTGEQYEIPAHVFDPDNLQIVSFVCSEDLYLYEEISQEELHDYLYVYVIYDDNSEDQIEDYEITDFVYGNDSFTLTWNQFSCQVNVYYYEVYNEPEYEDPSEEGGFNFEDLLQYLRMDPAELENFDIKDFYQEHKELIDTVFSFDENGCRIVINAADDRDLLALINIFFGIPAGEEMLDIDETLLLSYVDLLNETSNFDIVEIFQKVVGVSLADFLTDDTIEETDSFEDGICVRCALTNGGEIEYFATGVGVRLIESGAPFTLTEEEIESAQDFSTLQLIATLLLMQVKPA